MNTLQTVFPANDFTLIAVILGLPLLGAFVNGVFGKRLGKEAVTLMALSVMGVAFLASILSFVLLQSATHHGADGESAHQAARFYWNAWHWLDLETPTRALSLDVKFSLDALNGTMCLIVTGIGFLIHLYSTAYMADDPGYHRFFSYLNLFIFSMLVLILGDNLAVLFVGWEGVGLCSYLLIGFWYEEDANASAGKKAFITNRIGDFGLLVAMGLLVYYGGALDWNGIDSGASGLTQKIQLWPIGRDVPLAALVGDWINTPVYAHASNVIAFFLFLGCAGKSAQFPLYVWLPDAMAGPTPVSALIHAATMVTAGVYLMCRMSGVFAVAPTTMLFIAATGAFTALLAATIALVQTDIKKVLAYSTVSQLGYMFLATGVGAFTAGFFHVLTHAFFKACLFLGAGSVIHAMHSRIHDHDGSQDMRNMGGMKKFMPITHITFLVSCIAIAGIPPLAGFWSKDEILYLAMTQEVTGDSARALAPDLYSWPSWAGTALYAVGALTAVMTAFYMFRLYFNIFQGDFKGWTVVKNWVNPHGDDHAHGDHAVGAALDGPVPKESPLAMTVPLMILAALAAVGGFLNAPLLKLEWLHHWLEPVFASASTGIKSNDPEHALMGPMAAVGAVIAVAGTGAAYWVYVRKLGKPAAAAAERAGGLYRLVLDKWRVDELYEETVIGAIDALGDFFNWADQYIIDGIIAKLSSAVVKGVGALARLTQTGRVQGYAAMMVFGFGGLGWYLLSPHAAVKPFIDHRNGQYSLQAAPGLGYSYRWSQKNAEGKFDPIAGDQFGPKVSHGLRLERGKEKTVRLEVKNAFGVHAIEDIHLARPAKPAGAPGSVPTTLRIQQGADGKVRALPKGGLPTGHPALKPPALKPPALKPPALKPPALKPPAQPAQKQGGAQ